MTLQRSGPGAAQAPPAAAQTPPVNQNASSTDYPSYLLGVVIVMPPGALSNREAMALARPEVPAIEGINFDGAADENDGETWFDTNTDNAGNDWNPTGNVDSGESWGATVPEKVEGTGLDEMTNEQTASGEQGACREYVFSPNLFPRQ